MKTICQSAGWLLFIMATFLSGNSAIAQQACQASISAAGPLTFCQGDSVILTASSGASYNWSNGAKTRSITAKTAGKYAVTVTNAAGCMATSAATTVSVNALPVVTLNPFSAVSIHAAPFTLNGGQPINGTYTGPGVINGQFDPAAAGLGTHTITYRYSDLNGCANQASRTISVGSIPDASVSDSLTFFTNCTYSYTSGNFLLEITNSSATKATNQQYVITWGDGSQNTYGSNFSTASHTYTNPGSFQMMVTVYGPNGAVGSKTYTVFNGSNPSFGVASQGNTNDCAPATFTFDIINTAGNTPSTVYTFQFDDGSPALTFTHANLPKTITHTFTKSASGKPGNAFTLQAYATNPCGTTPATVGGIRISGGPIADFDFSPDSMSCVNTPITLIDKTDGGFNANASNPLGTGSYTRKWVVSPATGWNFVSGNSTSNNPVLNFSQPGKYLVKLIVTPTGPNTKCLSDSISKTIDIQTPPKAAFTVSSNPNSNCGPVTVATQNQSTGPDLKYLWKVSPATGWSYVAGSDSASATPQFLFSKAGDYKIALTANNRCAPASKADTTISIKGKPEVSLPAAQTYCGPQIISFSANDPNHLPVYDSANTQALTFNWLVTGANGAVFSNQTTATSAYPTINFTKAGVYTVSVTATNSCGTSTPATQTITIEALPVITLNNRSVNICKGQGGATLTATGASTYVWTPAIGLSATTGATVLANPTVTTTYKVTGTNAATGCADTATVTVVVLPNPTVQVAASANSICVGQAQTNLTASGADSFAWFPATGLNKTSGASVIASPAVTTTYNVVGTVTATGCTDTASVTITVNPLPVVSAGTDLTVCDQPIPVTLQGSPANGTWSGANVTAAGIFTPNGKGTFSLIYTFTNANGCVNADTTLVTVVDPIMANAGTNAATCLNSTINLTGLPAGGTWSGSPFITVTGAFTPASIGTFTLTYTYGTGSCVTSDEVEITVLPLPQAPVVAPASICPGNSTTLTATGQAIKLEWFTTATGGTVIFTGSNYTTPALQVTTTYYVQASNASGCNSVRTPVVVTVNPTPAAPVVQPVTICGPGNTATLAVSAPAGTYEWFTSATAITPVFTGTTFTTPALQNTTTYYVQATVNGCVGPRASVMVTVQPAIAQNTISGVQTICAGTVPAVLSGSQPTGGNGTYVFEWESSTTSATTGFTTVSGVNNGQHYNSAALSQTTWFRRKVTSATCQPFYSSVIEVTVVPVIAQNTISQSQTICSNSVPAALTGSAPTGGNGSYTYLWESSTLSAFAGFAPAAGVNNQQHFAPGTLTQTTWFRRTVTSAPCNVNTSAAIEITVNPLIAGNTISAPQAICTGSVPTPLTATQVSGGNGSFTYLWESSTTGATTGFAPAAGNNNQAGYTPAALSQHTWFRRVVISGPCQSISPAVAISVSPAISGNTISGNQTICIGNSPATLTGATPAGGNGTFTYRWESSTTGASGGFAPAAGNHSAIAYTPSALNQTTWLRRVVISGGCENISAAVEITVSPVITQNIISTAQIIYAGNVPAPLNGMAPQGGNSTYTYTWEISTTGVNGTFAPAPGVNTNQHYSPAALTATSWFRRVVTSGGCTSVSAALEITVTPGIGNNTILADQTICAGNTPMALQGSTPAGGNGSFTYLWEMSTTDGVSGFTTAPGQNNGIDYAPAALNQTTWFRRTVIAGGYTHTSNAVKIDVSAPVATNSISLSQTICEGTAPIGLTGSLPTGGNGTYTYLWERSITGPAAGFANAPGVNNLQNYNPGSLNQTTWFRRKVMANGCSEVISEAVKITVVPTPTAPVVMGTITCPGIPVTLTVENASGTYEWYDSKNATTPIATGTSFITPALSYNTTYYVQQITATCPGPRVAVTAEVYQVSANATEAVSIIRGQRTQLRASGGISYQWEPAIGLNDPKAATPMASPEVTTTYTVTVVTPEGCIVIDDVTVLVTAPVKLVNTFSPNGDGINDTWEIEHIEKYPDCRLEIFNRWGNLVYSSRGYSQPWDGRSNGQFLPVATYYYVLYLKDSEAPISGSITIIK